MLVLMAYAGEKHLTLRLNAIKDNMQRWMALLLASYVLGHLIGAVSPGLLVVYSAVYRPRWGTNIPSYQERSKTLVSTYVGYGCPNDDDIQEWAQTVIRLRSPSASAVIDHIEADAKFFRGLVIVLLLALAITSWQKKWASALLCLALVLLVTARCFDLQASRETKTYQFFIAICASQVAKPASGYE